MALKNNNVQTDHKLMIGKQIKIRGKLHLCFIVRK